MDTRTALCGLLMLLLSAGSTRADITTGLIASYSFNGHTNDISGQANHGSAQGALVFTTDRFGNVDGAGEFNGVNSYVRVPASPSLNSPTSAVTQAAWVMSYGVSQVGFGFNPILMKSVTGENAFMYRMTTSPSGFGAAFNNWTTHANADSVLNLNQWYHLVTVFDGTTLCCYLDGAPVDTLPMALTITQDNRDLTIGADTPGVLEIFYGKLDDVRVYSRALSAADVLELYGGPATGVPLLEEVAGVTLGPSYPNPATHRSVVEFALDRTRSIGLQVYDVRGRSVRSLLSGPVPGGRHSQEWDGRDDRGVPTPAGTYFFRLEAGPQVLTSRVTRIR
ncbi:MAG: hypothetical protein DHS20C21_05490 [Gemmatimonadota bacterium]|nr:MAG: hypothetical protein DHS20C21_05490 [Gemmatimonadota bacterium]